MIEATSSEWHFTTTDVELNELLEHVREISHLESLMSLARWDLQVTMPLAANQIRGQQMATFGALVHERKVSPRLGELLESMEQRVQDGEYTDVDRGLVRQARRNYNRATKTPVALVKETAEVASQAMGSWHRARSTNDFASFAPYLRRMVALKRQMAECLGYQGTPYNALLDLYEPGMTLDELNPILNRVREATLSLLHSIQASGRKIDTSILYGTFDHAKQLDFCHKLLEEMGYRFNAGRLDISAHPFTSGIGSPFDVRVTTRVNPATFVAALRATLHEGGHAVYEQGSHPLLVLTTLGGGASMGLHESESRLWENYIGGSLPFWKHHFPLLCTYFPESFAHREVGELVRALGEVRPSLIRIEADEVTYNLHIIIRFELEQALINGELEVADLPQAWNKKYHDYLGVTPKSDTEGVLQDIHWSQGSFGYFPTYTLGNLYGAQIYYALRRVFPDYDERLATEGTGFILDWLREKLYVYGLVYTPSVLVYNVTGEELNPEYFVQYAHAKFGAIYGLSS